MPCVVSITATDVAGNANTAATGVTSYTVDNIAPTVIVANDKAHRLSVRSSDSPIRLSATFGETNTIVAPSITITNGVSSGSNLTQPMLSTDNKHWYYDWTVPSERIKCISLRSYNFSD